MTFEFSSALPKGEVTLHVHYTGILNDQLKGFYRSKYFHPSHPEEERYMAVTQFEVRLLLYFLLLVPLLPSPLLPPSGHLSFVVSLVFRSRLPMQQKVKVSTLVQPAGFVVTVVFEMHSFQFYSVG